MHELMSGLDQLCQRNGHCPNPRHNSVVRTGRPKVRCIKTPTSQFPPPTTPDPLPPCSPNVNIFNSPFWITTKTSIHVLALARFPDDSQYCLRHSIPSFAHGAPRRANSSSVMLIVVEPDSSLCALRSSSSCASRIMVCERLEAKPNVGVKKDELDVCAT